jgi:hypothetical protein
MGICTSLIPFRIIQQSGFAAHCHPVRIWNRCALSTSIYEDFVQIVECHKEISMNRSKYKKERSHAKKFIKKFRSEPEHTYYFSTGESNTSHGIIKKSENLLKISSATDLMSFVRPRLLNYVINKMIKYNYLFDQLETDQDFIYFPLHSQPEYATKVLGPMYVDQITLIKQLSRILPVDCEIFVKEHPTMIGRRPLRYYQKLSEIANVSLIDPYTDPYSIIQSANLTTTISGTSGLESILLETPVITFGKPYYNMMPGVVRYNDCSDPADTIFDLYSNDLEIDDTALIDHIAAVIKNSFSYGYTIGGTRNNQKKANTLYREFYGLYKNSCKNLKNTS